MSLNKDKKPQSVQQIATTIGMDPHLLLSTLRGPNYSYKIPSISTHLGSFITETILEEFNKNGSLKTAPTTPSVKIKQEKSTKRFNINPDYETGVDFEKAVGDFIHDRYPNSHLSNVFMFLAERLSTNDKYGREIDHLLHLRRGSEHRLVILECKHSNLELEGNSSVLQEKNWIVETKAGRNEVREQMWIQARALLQLLKPIPEVDLVIEAIALLSDKSAQEIQDTRGKDDPCVHYRIMSFDNLDSYFTEMASSFEFFRVGQSEFLRRLRQGMRCDQLGHPDIRDAIEFHRRSRQTLDYGLFKHFKPTKGKWAINGTAGMGKSVLLAYSLCAFATDHKLTLQKNGQLKLEKVDLSTQNLPPLEERKILVYSLKEKQRRVIDHYWNYLIKEFQRNDTKNQLLIQRPDIRIWQLGEEITGNVVLIDEAHDLSDEAQRRICDWLNESPNNHYLLIACDRHQKLRLIGDSEHKRMIAGLHFGRHTKALKRVYRNPFSIYAAGLSLMFRWFAPDGPKVIPDQTQLRKDFGFTVNQRSDTKDGICDFEMTEDAHPGNHWHHCVSNFHDPDTAHKWLSQYQIGKEDVLWVRFKNEDPEFDYELLNNYQYHNLNSNESASIIDKYIKGQEFPVVVIEGVGEKFNALNDSKAMFEHRRELYLCSSRATVFLFFIYSGAQGGAEPVSQELEFLRKELSCPLNTSKTSQKWGLKFNVFDRAMPLTQFEDLIDPIEELRNSDSDTQNDTHEPEDAVIEEAQNSRTRINIEVPEVKASARHPSEITEQTTTTLTKRIQDEFGAKVTVEKLQKGLHNFKYSPIDFYTVELLAHYLNVELRTLSKVLSDYKELPEKNDRLNYKIVQKTCKALNVPEPWNHPALAVNPQDLLVKFTGQLLTRKNITHKLESYFSDSNLSEKKIQIAMLEVLPTKSKNTEQTINLIELFRIVKLLKLDGDKCLLALRPHYAEIPASSKSEIIPSNLNGYSVLDRFTPRELGAYLDVKPFKIMGEIMKIPQIMNLTISEELNLDTVEFICKRFGRDTPWNNLDKGNAVSKVIYSLEEKVVTNKNIFSLIKKIYKKNIGPQKTADAINYMQGDVQKPNDEFELSATKIYEMLKITKLKPEIMLKHLRAEI